jgi:hypothetical protein
VVIRIDQQFALAQVVEAHRAEARNTTGCTVLTL